MKMTGCQWKRAMIALVGSVLLLMPTTAAAEYCDVDLLAETADRDLEYHVYFGVVEGSFSESPDIALCVAPAARGEDVHAPTDAILVGLAEGGRGGRCNSAARATTCGGGGCDVLTAFAVTSDNLMLHGYERGTTCTDTLGVLDASLGRYELGPVPTDVDLHVFNAANPGSMGYTRGTTNCQVSAGGSTIHYGHGRYYLSLIHI